MFLSGLFLPELLVSVMPLLGKAKPGDVVKITYLRKVDGKMKEFTTECTLVARARPSAQ